MSATFTVDRRSTRMFMRVRVVASGKNISGRKFRTACETIVINAHGGLLYLDQEIAMDSLVMLANPFTQEEQECRVVYLGESVSNFFRHRPISGASISFLKTGPAAPIPCPPSQIKN